LKTAKRFLLLFVILGLFVFIRGDGAVLAAVPAPTTGHYQLQAVIVDEPQGYYAAQGHGEVAGGERTSTHEVFLGEN
jgi:hypothetical protein